MSVKDKLDEKMKQAQAEIEKAKPVVVIPEGDPELADYQVLVRKGYAKAAYRSRNGALVVTH